MFSHLVLGANDIEQAKKFYDAILGAIGYETGVIHGDACVYSTPTGKLILKKPINGEPATHGNGSTIGFGASSPELVKAWHDAGVANGGMTCEDPPGDRNGAFGHLYLAYLRDPTGNKLCAGYRYS